VPIGGVQVLFGHQKQWSPPSLPWMLKWSLMDCSTLTKLGCEKYFCWVTAGDTGNHAILLLGYTWEQGPVPHRMRLLLTSLPLLELKLPHASSSLHPDTYLYLYFRTQCTYSPRSKRHTLALKSNLWSPETQILDQCKSSTTRLLLLQISQFPGVVAFIHS
jgi:hypothetical protein